MHVYTGNGKGKSTAAFGLALRALFAGKKVYIAQFIKDMKYHETGIETVMDGIKIEQLGAGCFIDRKPNEHDREVATAALQKCGKILESGKFDVVILDEITILITQIWLRKCVKSSTIILRVFYPETVLMCNKSQNHQSYS